MKAELVCLSDQEVNILNQIDLALFNILEEKQSKFELLVEKNPINFFLSLKASLEQGFTPVILNPQMPSHIQEKILNIVSSELTPSAGRFLLCSSGTTSLNGLGKKFLFDLKTSFLNGHEHIVSLGLNKEKKNILLPMPLYHSFGLIAGLFASISHKHTLFMGEEGGLSAPSILESIEKYDIDHLYLTPSLARSLVKVLTRKKKIISKLASISIGSSMYIAKELVEMMDYFPNTDFYFTYGLSEMGPRVSSFYAGKLQNKNASLLKDLSLPVPIGVPLKGVSYQIINDELQIDSPYKALNIDNGFYKTGDRVSDEEGLRIHGRLDFMIIKSGVNIYPEEIESLFDSFDEIIEAALIPRKSEAYGQVPILVIYSRADESILKKKVLEHLQNNLPPHYIPSAIYIRKEPLPKTSMGKKQISYLVKEYENE